jgi:hypothetical protein
MEVPQFQTDYTPPGDLPTILYEHTVNINFVLLTWNILLCALATYTAYRLHYVLPLLPLLIVSKAATPVVHPLRSNASATCQFPLYMEILINVVVIVLLFKLVWKGVSKIWTFFIFRSHRQAFPVHSSSESASVDLDPPVFDPIRNILNPTIGSWPCHDVYDLGPPTY